jgi:hypothetical protein
MTKRFVDTPHMAKRVPPTKGELADLAAIETVLDRFEGGRS